MSDRPDILGPPWRARTLALRPDALEDAPVATLVHRPVPGATTAMLQVHGYNDYIFHTELGQEVAGWGHLPAGLDLRRYGRSWTPGVAPFSVRSMDAYGEELDAAVAALRSMGARRIWVNAHSTGALAAARWLQTRPGVVQAVVFNAPFLAPPRLPAERWVLPALRWLGTRAPDRVLRGPRSPYTRSLHAPTAEVPDGRGTWTFLTDWKRAEATPYTLGWFAAVARAWEDLAQAGPWATPTLLLTSARSIRQPTYGPDWHIADGVLDVDRLHAATAALATNLVAHRLEGAVHDVWLSAPSVRAQAYDLTRRWLEEIDVHDP